MTDVLKVVGTQAAPRALRRPRLIEMLDHASTRRLTLVCAPPGTGKSTLVADWTAGKPGVPVLWVDLNAVANDRARLHDDLAAALDDLSTRAEVVVVLEDAQELTDRGAWNDVTRFALTSPIGTRWIIVSRVDPPIGIRRLQLQGELAQIRVADLAFDADETGDLMRWFGLDVPLGALRRLAKWSEGWAAALCLAARTMQTESIETRPWERLEESQAVVLDFLVEEVLDQISTRDRRFLLRLSAADLLTPELAALLTGSDRAGERLHRLERAGTFLLEADSSGSRYRFHGLMAALLRARLHDELPSEARDLTSTAATWYKDHGYLEEAERHTTRAEEWPLVGRLRAERCVEHLLYKGTLLSFPGGSPTAASVGDRAMRIHLMIDAFHRHDRRWIETLVSSSDPEVTEDPSSPGEELLNRLITIEASRWMPAISPTPQQRAAARLAPGDPAARSALSAYLALREAESRLVASHDQEARPLLEEIAHMVDVPEWTRAEAGAIVAVLDVVEGDPRKQSPATPIQNLNASGDATSWIRVAAAVAHGLRGETAGLRRQTEALVAGRDAQHSWLLEQCARVLVTVAANWSPPSAAPSLDLPPAGLVHSVAIALGIVETVDHRGGAHTVGGPLEQSIADARRALADPSPRRLDVCLQPWLDRGVLSGQNARSVVELYALAAVGEARKDDEAAAAGWLRWAIESAAPTGLWGPLLAYEHDLQRVVERHGWELGESFPEAVDMLKALQSEIVTPLEPLTERERVVLHYLPTLMSNAEIAAEMLVSVNTVKTHLKSIYRKLGVERRRDAMLRARQVEAL